MKASVFALFEMALISKQELIFSLIVPVTLTESAVFRKKAELYQANFAAKVEPHTS